jgi:hypothetical protein
VRPGSVPADSPVALAVTATPVMPAVTSATEAGTEANDPNVGLVLRSRRHRR